MYSMYTIKIGRCLKYDCLQAYPGHAYSETHADISDMTLEWFFIQLGL